MDSRTAKIQLEVGLLIKKCRMAVGISQDALAAAVGLSRSSVANVECGRQKIGVPLLYMIAEVLQTTPHDLLPPIAGNTETKLAELPLPQHLPEEDTDWIRALMNPDPKTPHPPKKKRA